MTANHRIFIRRLAVLTGAILALGSLPNLTMAQDLKIPTPTDTVDPRGPIQVAGRQAVKLDDGVEARGNQVSVAAGKAPVWSAQWIWLEEKAAATNPQIACFRKEIALDDVPAKAVAWVSADWHYRLYINGHLVGRGPADAGEDWPSKRHGKTGLYFSDHYDLAPFFRKGANAIAVEVFGARLNDWYGSSGYRGLFFQVDLTLHNQTLPVRSDLTWRGLAGTYFEGGKAYPAREPAGWRLSGFNDSAWSHAVAAGDHWPKLLPSELSTPLEIVYPVKAVVRVSPGINVPARPFQDGHGITLTGNGSFSLQYDRVMSGYAGLKIKGGAGATLDVLLEERFPLANDGYRRRSLEIVLGDGVQYVETPFYSSFTFIEVKASNVRTPIEIQDVSALFTSYPVTYQRFVHVQRRESKPYLVSLPLADANLHAGSLFGFPGPSGAHLRCRRLPD